MILFCFISLLGTASAEEIIDNNIASNDASIDIDVIESPIHEDISISTVKNSDVSADDSLSVNGSASKGKLSANKLSADHTFTGSTFDELQTFLNSGNINDGDTVYLGNKTITSSWQQWDNPEKFIDINIPNLVLCGGTSSNPDSFSTLRASAGLFNIVSSGVTFSNLILLNGQVNNDNPAPIKMQGANTKFENCVFENNGGRSGGAIYGTSAATGTTFNNCNFTRNGNNWNGYGGGAFYLEGSDTIVTNCNFDHNNGAGSIGAFHAGSNTLIENCSFTDNSAGSYGAVHLVGDNVTITNCNFTNNQGSNGPGGAIYYDGNGLKVTDSNFDSNKGNAASAIHSTGAINVTNANFTSNGPGVIYSGGDTQIIDCNFVGTTGTSVSVISRGSTKSENNNFTNNGGSSIYSYGITEINNTNFVNNGASSYNNINVGAVYSADATTVSNSKFENNKADNNGYGGIYSMGETNVTNCNFTGNSKGTIFSADDTKITDCNIENGATSGQNSVSVVSYGNTYVDNSNFTNNPTASIYSAFNTEITNSNFINNGAGSYNNTNVGAVYSGGTTTVSNSKFERNNASNNAYGGINSQGAATISGSNFTENSGGAIHSYSDAEITNCIIENHSSQNSAVDIYGTAIVSNTNFTNNSNNGYGSGGALYTNGDNSQITDCNFENNKAPSAGAVYLSGEGSKVENCNFTNNNATSQNGQGGAIDVVGSNTQVINSNFKENNANDGGAIYAGASGLTLTDSTFEENSATHGGAIDIYHDDASLTNCNFTDNTASQQGGAVYIGADCYNADMTECNFTGNTAGTGTAIYAADGATGKVTDCEFGVKPELNVNNGYPVLTLTLESDYNNIIVGDIEGGPSGGSTVPEANETITLEIFDSEGTLVATVTNKTDENGQMKYDYSHLPRGNYTYKATYMDGQTKEGPLNMGVVEGDNFSAIQAAINAAEPGSVIFLEGKTYYNDIQGTMTINKPITIIGTDGTVLDAENISRIFTIADNIDNVNLNNITFINGFVEGGDGGAIYVSQGSDNLNLVNCNFTNNHATGENSHGGALFIGGGANNGNIINTTFDNNTAYVDGGAIRNDGGWGWNIYDTSFTNNSAVHDADSDDIPWGGGAIWTCNAPMTIYNSNFTDNNGTYGGAIRGAVSTYECLFDNNTATNGNGGAIDVTTDRGLYDQIDLEFVNTTFVNNDAKGSRGQDRAQGGGIHIYHLKEIDMYGCYCENNTADRGGAIDFYELERTHVENCTILNNNASSEGGGMAIFCNQSTFKDTNVSNNNAGTDGGAIWVIGHNALFDNITSINNTAERGGSSFINGSDTVIVNCNITNNTAVFNPSKPDDSGLGGAIDVIGDNCRIINLTSEDNNAYRGGSTFIRGDNTVVYNSTFDNNNADLRGGGLNIAGNGVIVENVTANNNNASLMGGGIYVVANGTQFKNITADNNQAERGGGAFIEGNNVVVDIGDFSNNKAIFNESNPEYSGLGGALDIAGNGCNVTNVNSTGNTAYRGGSTFIRGNDTHVEKCKLDDNNATLRGGGLNIAGERCTVDNVEINNNNAGTMGGGIYVVSNGTTFTNIVADNNQAERGGAAFINGTNILVQHGELSNNLARFNESKVNESGLGGGFDIVGDNVTVDDVHSNNNQAYRGGSTFIRGNNVTVSNCNLDNNNATVRGGALNIGGGDNCKVINVSVSNNKAGEDGGAIYVIGNYSLFDNVNSTNNTAERGGSSFVAGDYINVTNCNLDNNNATVRGGGLDVAGSGCVFENVSISNCNAYGDGWDDGGGAVYVVGDDNRFTNVTTVNNTAINYGGSSYIGGSNNLIENCTVSNNSAFNGGGIFIMGDDSKFTGNNITYNNAIATDEDHDMNIQGGGVFIFGEGSNFTNNNISSNHAKDNGGGVTVFFGPDTYFEDIYAFNNTAENGGFSNLQFCDGLTIKNSTFYSNHATGNISVNRGEGGAFHLFQSENIDIQGNFSYNTATNGSAIYVEDSTMYVHDTTFFDNQAHSYYLLVSPEENTTYTKYENVTVRISLIGGDNVANAIHNREAASDITLRNLTYPFYNDGVLENRTFSPNEDVRPVIGYENSDNGNLIYLDDLEDNQVIEYEIFNVDTGEMIYNWTANRTDISGSVTLTLSDLPVGNYSVRARYNESTYYTNISNQTVFRIVDIDLVINKTVSDELCNVSDIVDWNVSIINDGDYAGEDVIINDFLPDGLDLLNLTFGFYNSTKDLWTNGTLNLSSLILSFSCYDNGTGTWIDGQASYDASTNTWTYHVIHLKDNTLAYGTFNENNFIDILGEAKHEADTSVWTFRNVSYDLSNDIWYYYTFDYNDEPFIYGGFYIDYFADYYDKYSYDEETGIWTLTTYVYDEQGQITGEKNITYDEKSGNWTIDGNVITPDIVTFVPIDISLKLANGINTTNISLDISTFDPNATAVMNLVTNVTKEGIFTNVANVSTVTRERNYTNNIAFNTTRTPIDLVANKTVSNETSQIGDSVDWNVTVLNNGTYEAINVTMNDYLPNGLNLTDLAFAFFNGTNDLWTNATLNLSGKTLAFRAYNKASGTWIQGNASYDETSNTWTYYVIDLDENTLAYGVFNESLFNDTLGNATYHGDIDSWTYMNISYDLRSGNWYYYRFDYNGKNVTYGIFNETYFLDDFGVAVYDASNNIWIYENISYDANTGNWIYYSLDYDGNILNYYIFNPQYFEDIFGSYAYDSSESTWIFVKPVYDEETHTFINKYTYYNEITGIWNIDDKDIAPTVVIIEPEKVSLTPAKINLTLINSSNTNTTNITLAINSLESKGIVIMNLVTNVTEKGNLTNIVNVTTVAAEYNYTNNIANNTTTVLSDNNPNMTVNKTSLNTTDFIVVNDTVAFNITVNNTGDISLYGVNVTEIFNSTELEYINHSNNQTWIKIGDSFIFNGTKQTGDLIAYTIYLRNNGDCTLDNITISNVYDPTELEYVKGFDYLNTAIIDHNFFLNITLDAGSDLSFTLWFKTLKDDFKNMTPSVTYDIVYEVPGTEYNPSISIEKNFKEIMAPLHVNETSTFTIWFKALTNGTLVNNVTAKSNETNETNDTANVTVYKPNMTVQKIANDNVTYVGNQTSFTIVVTNTGDCNLTDVVVTDTDFSKGLVYDHYTNSSRQWTYDGKGHWTLVNPLLNGTSANFTVFFNVTVNGTLVNNVSAVSNLTNETNGTNQTRAYLPNMTVQKIANDEVVYVGNQTSFTIVVTNTGDCNLTDVVVTDTDFSKGLVYDHYTNSSRQWTYDGKGHWTLVNGLENGTSANFTVFFNVTVNGTLVNNVSAKSNLTNETNGTNQTRAYLPNMTVQKIANDEVVYVGNTTSFTIVVTNTGDCNLSEIVVTDEKFSSGLIYKNYQNTTGLWNKVGDKYTLVGDLAPGASARFTVIFDVIDNGTLVNNVSAVSNLTNETNGTNNTTAYRPNMTVQKIANDEVVYVGNTTSFTIVVTNTGDCNLSSVVVTDDKFSTGLRYKDYTNGSRQWTYDGEGHWTLDGILTNGSSANFTVIFDVMNNGTLVNNVSAVSNLTNETNGTNNTTAYRPNMTVQKIANDEVVYVGNTTSFTIVVTNTGDCNLTDVVVTDTDFTQGLVYDHYTNSSREWTYDGNGHWTLVNPLLNGTSANFTVFFNVTVNGTLVNNVSAKSNLTNETNGTNQTRAYLPNMTVQKIANDKVVYVGNTTSFDIIVTNTGDCNLSEIVVTDEKFSSGLLYKEYKNTTGLWNKLGNKYTLVGDLAPGASASFTIFFDVIDNGTLVNNVSAVSNLTNETNGTNNTTAYRPNMTVQKIANDDLVYVGNTTSFTIVVTNTGDCNLSSVVVTDKDFSTGLRYKDYTNGSRQWIYDGDGHWTLDGILTNGSSANFTVIFDVISNGTLVNNVSAKSNLTNETNGTNNTTAKAPNMTVQKISLDKIVPVGTSARFEIVVTNTGDCELSDVYVIDTDHDEGLVYLKYENGTRNWTNNVDGRWDLVGALGINQSASFIIYFNVTANGTLVNNVTAGSNLTNETNGTNSTSSLVPNMTVQKIANDNITYIGNVTSFTIVVRNTGEANLTNIVVSDTDYSEGLVFNGTFEPIRGEWTAAGDRTWSLGFLEVGDNASFTLYFNVTANGTLVNNVSAHSDLTNETNGTNETKAYAPNMTVQKIANDNVTYVGNTTSFTIVVTNTGDCNLTDVVVTDTDFTKGLVYDHYTNSSRQWTYDGAGHWTLVNGLENGTSANFTVFFNVTVNGTLVNNVSAKSNLTNETNGTNQTRAYLPNMTVQKIANDKVVYVGNTTSFTIVVTNTGDCNLSDVVVTDKQFSSGLRYKEYTNGTGRWNYNEANKTWTLVGSLENGTSASFTVVFDVIDNGTLVNNVSAVSNLTNETNGTNNTTAYRPNMTVQKIANDDVVYVGNTTSFDIIVTNTGDCNLSSVIVTDKQFSSGLRYKDYTNGSRQWTYDGEGQWTLVGILTNGSSASFTVVFDVIDNGTLVNNVSAVSNLTNETNGTNNTTAYRPNMTVQKIANDDVVYVGNTTSFDIIVTNTGDCNLSSVIVTDKQFSSGLRYKDYTNGSRQWTYDGEGQWTLVGILTNGSSASFTVVFDVIDNGTLVNNVSAVSNLTNETNGTNNTTSYRPNMTVQKIANDKVVYVGNITSFTIVVTNTGDCNLSDVVVTDKQFSSGLRYKEYTNGTGRWNYNEANKTWTLVGSLENGTSASFTVVFDVIDNGTLVNNVSAVSNLTNETNGTNNTTAYRPNMTVQKIANDKVVYVGNITSFTIVVTNTGDCNLSDVVVTDKDFSSGLRYKEYTNGTGRWNYNEANKTWTLVGSLENGTSANFTVVFDVIDNGTLVNNVSAVSNLTNETNGTNNTTAYRPNMTVQKIANDKVVYVGNITSFTIVVTNTGDCNLSDVVVTDKDFSSGLRYKEYTNGTGRWNYNEANKTWTLVGSLENGTSANFTVFFDVIDNGTLVNNVSASSNLTNETNGTNNTTAYRPNMTVQKIANDKVVYVGNITSFTIVVTNTGDCNLSDVVVTDKDFSSGLRYKEYTNGTGRWNYNEANKTWTLVGSLENGTSADFTVFFEVISNGTLVNNVSASSNLTNETNGTNNTTAKAPNMTVQKISIDKVVPVGNSSRFEIVVTNTGDCELSDVYVVDTDHDVGLVYDKYDNGTGKWNYDGNGRWDLVGPLGINENASFIIYFNVTANGTLRNNVTAGSNLTNETNGTNETTSLVPNMTIEKIANQKVIYVGNTTSFTIIVRNTGEANLTNILVTDKDYSEGLVFNGVYEPIKGDWTYNGDNTWSLASLNVGEDASFTVYFNVTLNGTLVNNASAHSDLTNETNATNDTRAYQPNLTVRKITYNEVVYVGEHAIFTIMVYNTGDCELSNVTVKETWFSEGLVFDDWVPNGNYLWDFNEDEMTWTMKGILTPFENNYASFIVYFNVTQNGTLKNNVSASSNLTNETNSSNETHAYDPKMTIEKIANDDVVYVGNTTSFTIVVRNTGDCELSEIVVTDDKYSDGLEYSKYENGSRLWNYVDGKWKLVGSLAPGESADLTVFFTVISNGTLNNTASAVSNLTNETNSTNNTTAYKPNITVLKIANDDVVYVGNVTSFTILVINTGDCDLSGIYVIDDDYSDGLKYNRYENGTGKWTYDGERFTLVGDLAAGESADFTVFFDVVENGTLVNNVSAGSNLTNETNNTNNTTAKPVCDVIIYKEVNTTECLVGDLVEWTITVVNVGPSTALDVIVKDVLSKDLELVSANSTSYNNATGEWTVGDLKVNTPVSLTLVTRVLASGTIYNNATVNTTTDESNYTNNNASNKTDAKVLCDLVITKAVNQSSCNVSDIIQWNITVTNLGPHSASDVIVKDLLPDGLELISYNVSIGNFNDVISEWSIGTLDKDQVESLILVTKVLVNGTIVNIATVNTTTPDLDYTNNEANNTTVAENICDLEVIKIVNSKKVYIGDLLTWTIRVTNNGPSEALDVCVSDILPEGLIFVNYRATTGKYDDVSGTWTVGKLASGSSATLDLITRIDELGNITNPVSVNTTTPESNYSNNKANNTTEAIPIVDLVLDKSSDKAKYNVNDTMHWIIKVTNRGPCDAIDAYVLDVLPKGTKFISYEATKGTYDETTGVWSIGDIANGEEVSIDILCKALLSGNFTNNATVYNNVTDTNTSNNYDNSTVEIIEDTPEPGPNPEPVPDEPIPNEPPVTTMLKTGNPLVVLLLALIAMAGTLGLRRRKE